LYRKPTKYISPDEALAKLQKYCVYQDRCHKEVRTKLLSLGIYGDTLEEIMADLITENFLNEERFACSYARGKFNLKKWGRMRIQNELRQRRISAYCIRKAMKEIDEKEYRNTIRKLIEKKAASLQEDNDFIRNNKIAQYLFRKGYESNIIWPIIKGDQDTD